MDVHFSGMVVHYLGMVVVFVRFFQFTFAAVFDRFSK